MPSHSAIVDVSASDFDAPARNGDSVHVAGRPFDDE